MICAGIDAGSRAVKALLLDAGNMNVLGEYAGDQGVAQAQTAAAALDSLLEPNGLTRADVRQLVGHNPQDRTAAMIAPRLA